MATIKSKQANRKIPSVKTGSTYYKMRKFTGTNALLALVIASLVGFIGVSQLHKSSAYSTVCDYNGLCLNRRLGGTTTNTPVIAYPRSTTNEHFGFINTSYCGGGVVTPTCPFKAHSALNTRYLNNRIQQIKDFDTGYCVGSSAYSSQLGTTYPAALVPCGSADTYFVHNNKSDTIDLVEDISWTNVHGNVHWLCNVGNKYPVTVFGTSGNDSCRWQ